MRVVASLALWVSSSQEEAGTSVAGGCRSHGGGQCQKRLPGEGQAPTAAGALELGDTLSDLGQARSAAAALNQKQQHFDKCLDDWRQKHEESQAMLDASKKEARALSIQLLELRHSYEESTMSQEALRRENKHLKGTLC